MEFGKIMTIMMGLCVESPGIFKSYNAIRGGLQMIDSLFMEVTDY